MTVDGRHSTQEANHRLESFVFATAAARALGTGYTITASDIGRIAYDTDTGSYTRLTGVGPLTWALITAGTGAPLDATYLTRNSVSGLTAEFSLASISAGVLKHTVSGGVSTPAVAVAGTDYASPYVTVRTVTGTTDTLVLADASKCIETTNGSAVAVTIPPASSVAWVTGTVLELYQAGAGQITLTPGVGVTINSDGGKLKTTAQYATVGLRYRGSDTWAASGDLST